MGSKEANGKLLYQDEICMAFDVVEEDMLSSIHFRVIPKHAPTILSEATAEEEKVIGHLLLVASTVAYQKGLGTGYHLMVDEDYRRGKLKALHVFQRALHHMLWPTGPGSRL